MNKNKSARKRKQSKEGCDKQEINKAKAHILKKFKTKQTFLKVELQHIYVYTIKTKSAKWF